MTPFTATGRAVLELDRNLFDFVGGFLRRLRPRPRGGKRRVVWIFQFAALMADVQQIAVAAVDLLATLRHGDSMLLRVVQTVLTRLQRPLPPRGNHFQFGRQRLVRMLEAHLIVALSGAAVRHRGRRLPAMRP